MAVVPLLDVCNVVGLQASQAHAEGRSTFRSSKQIRQVGEPAGGER